MDSETVVTGLRAFFAVALDERRDEQAEWRTLYDSRASKEVIDRIRADVFRRLVETTARAQEQPETEEQLAPTLLGNRVAALDDYAESRYGIATSALWTRLWGVLGQAERQEIANAQLRVEMLANMTVAFAFVALLSAGTSIYRAVRVNSTALVIDWWTVLFAAVCVALTMASYRTAVYAFGGVADGITRLVDLHRVRVLTTFGLESPATFADERAMFGELRTLFANGDATALASRPLRKAKTP